MHAEVVGELLAAQGWRPRDLSTSNFPQLRGMCLSNYISDPVFRAKVDGDIDADPRNAVLPWVSNFGNSLTRNDLPWLRSLTSLPLILKGICHPDDARRASGARQSPRGRTRAA